MFDFTKISEVITDPRDFGDLASHGAVVTEHAISQQNGHNQSHERKQSLSMRARSESFTRSRNRFVEITMDKPLYALNRFLEWQSAAIVTERDLSASGQGEGGKGVLKPIAVVTKVDLLTWMVSKHKV